MTSELLIFRGTSGSEHSIHDMTTLCSDYRTTYMYVFRFSNLRQYVRQFSLFVRHFYDAGVRQIFILWVIYVTEVWDNLHVLSVTELTEGCVKVESCRVKNVQ